MKLNITDLGQILSELGSSKPDARAQFRPRTGCEMETLRTVLASIPADAPRGDGSILDPDGRPVDDYWFGVILAARREYGDDAEAVLRDWSKTSARYTGEGFDQAWGAFEPDHLRPVTMKSVHRLAETFGWKRPGRTSRYELLGRAAIMALAPMEWRVKGIFPKEGIGAIFGPSGSGKSYLALDLGIRIALGDAWFGRKTAACPVTYVMLEGELGLKNRIRAWEEANGRDIPVDFTSVPQSFDFSKPDDVEDLAAVLPLGGVIIVDTLNRASPGKDENSSKDMGDVISGMKDLQTRTRSLVMVVHHTGKDASKGMRGHSSLHAALDGAIEVKRDKNGRQWSAAKVKDGSDDIAVPFRLDVVHLGVDQDGEPITSCVAVPDASALIATEPRGPNQKIALAALRATPGTSLSWEEAVSAVAARLDVKPNKRTNEARRILNKLIDNKILKFDQEAKQISW